MSRGDDDDVGYDGMMRNNKGIDYDEGGGGGGG